MKNGDKPISPVECSVNSDGSRNGIQTGNTTYFETGLTKREYFAAMAMQGIIIHYGNEGEDLGKTSVWCADHVLSELEKP